MQKTKRHLNPKIDFFMRQLGLILVIVGGIKIATMVCPLFFVAILGGGSIVLSALLIAEYTTTKIWDQDKITTILILVYFTVGFLAVSL
ncbi:hypothetical protein [Faecalicoccus pleomorphus]|uniref:hypothetical protein n=1 Tax=Faecalicoccus pleomorphus TaxID=1323 RepID=UPI0029422E2D|nr:hypothetical protein [Faecalicoccus pleomorphus]